MTDKEALLKFPCQFPIKIIGSKTSRFATEITAIVKKHFPDTPDEAIRFQESQRGNFLSITATVYAHSQESIDTLYRELTKHPDIKMVL